VRVPVTGGPAGVGSLQALLVAEPGAMTGRPVVVCCFPGGGMNHRYFALGGSYDMADHLAAAGLVVLAFDHPGLGGSDVPDDPWTLVPDTVADLDVAGVRAALAGLAAGDLVDGLAPVPDPLVLGVGHSMGAMLVVHQQARHGIYAGLGLFGHSGRGLPEVLVPEEVADGDLVALARARFREPLPVGETAASEMLVGPSLPPLAADALAAARAAMLTCCGLASMIPGSHAHELATVDVPVFAGIAEHDIAGPPHEVPTYLTGTSDLTLHVLEGAFHNSNVAPRRRAQWDRFVTWARTVPR
jgi:alpha-beta hydrolase superfamily lysophospholipase